MVRAVTQFHVTITMMEMMTQICKGKCTVTENKLHDHDIP